MDNLAEPPFDPIESCSIVLVIYDPYDVYASSGALTEAVNSLDCLQGSPELILVNNNNPALVPKTSAYLREVAYGRAGTRLVETGGNLGCSGGFNRGAELANAASRILIYMSGDAFVTDPAILWRFSEVFSRYSRIGLAHPMSIYEDHEEFNFSRQYSARAFFARAQYSDGANISLTQNNFSEEIARLTAAVTSRQFRVRYPVISVPLTFLAIRRDLFDRLQGFDQGFLAGGENLDFTLRALQSGYAAAVVTNSFVFHRRLLFRSLGSAGKNHEAETAGRERFLAHWNSKWGRSPLDVYREIFYGRRLYVFGLRPVIGLFRVARRFLRGPKKS